jgi:aldose 1-epimerase
MTRFRCDREQREGETLYVLRDAATGASATIWPAFGNNCLAARLPGGDGRLTDLVLEPESLEEVRRQPSWWGVPLLFPWPGRIPGGEYEFGGQRYRLPAVDASGNAIHGFAKDRPWRVEAVSGEEDAAVLGCAIDSADHPETLEGYPFPYRCSVSYRLNPSGLSMRAEVRNVGTGPMPFGFGAHPYFRVPLAPDGERAVCLVTVPAARRWNLAELGRIRPETAASLPHAGGAPISYADVTEPVAGDHDLRRPRPLQERLYDGGFTELATHDGVLECFLRDPAAGLDAVMAADATFGTVVVYTPAGRPGVCFEPWTCPPNAFNLAARGMLRSGVMVLGPGDRWEGTMAMSLRPSGVEGKGS